MSIDGRLKQDTPVHEKRRTIFVSLVFALAVFLAGFAVVYILTRAPMASTCDDNDSFAITVDSPSVPFQLLLPIPIERNGSDWYLVNSLTLTQGNVTYSIIDTLHGRMLSVEGNGSISLDAQAARRDLPFYAVTPQNSSWLQRQGFVPYLVFLNASGRESEMVFSLRAFSCDHHYKYVTTIYVEFGDLKQGWQQIFGEAYVEAP